MKKEDILFPDNENIVFSPKGELVNLRVAPLEELFEVLELVKEILYNNRSEFITYETLRRVQKVILKKRKAKAKAYKRNKISIGSHGFSFHAGVEYF